MKFTLEKAIELNACQSGIDWYKANGEPGTVEATALLALEHDHYDWVLWLLTHLFTIKQNRQCAIFAAEQVLSIFEKKYPDDKRPRQAIDAAKEVLKHDTKKNRAALSAALSAADSAARSAESARKEMEKRIINYGLSLLEDSK